MKTKLLQYLPGWIKQIVTKLFTETLKRPLLSLLNRDKKNMQIFTAVNFPQLSTYSMQLIST